MPVKSGVGVGVNPDAALRLHCLYMYPDAALRNSQYIVCTRIR